MAHWGAGRCPFCVAIGLRCSWAVLLPPRHWPVVRGRYSGPSNSARLEGTRSAAGKPWRPDAVGVCLSVHYFHGLCANGGNGSAWVLAAWYLASHLRQPRARMLPSPAFSCYGREQDWRAYPVVGAVSGSEPKSSEVQPTNLSLPGTCQAVRSCLN